MFKLGYTKSTDNFNFNAPQNNAPLDRGMGYQPPTNLADGNTESLYPAYLPSNNIHTNLFPAFNPHGFFDDYWMTPPVDYRGLEVEDVDRSKNIVVTDPRDDEEPPGQLNTFNTKPGQRPIVDALRSFLKNQEIQTKNDPDRNMRDEIISRLKSHGLFKDRYNELSNSELRTLATNIAGVNNMDPNELIPKDINTQSSNVHSATNMVDQPEGSGQQGPGINSGNVPSDAHASLRGTVGKRPYIQEIQTTRFNNNNNDDDDDSVESAPTPSFWDILAIEGREYMADHAAGKYGGATSGAAASATKRQGVAPAYYQRVKELDEKRKREGPIRAGTARHVGPPSGGRYKTKQQQRKQQITEQDPEYVEQLRAMEEGRGAFDTTEEAGGAASATEATTYEDIKNAVENNRDLSKFISRKGSGLDDTSKLLSAAEKAISNNDISTYEGIERSLIKRYNLGAAPYVDFDKLKQNITTERKRQLASRMGKSTQSLDRNDLLQIANQQDISKSLNEDYTKRFNTLKTKVTQSPRSSSSSRAGPGRPPKRS